MGLRTPDCKFLNLYSETRADLNNNQKKFKATRIQFANVREPTFDSRKIETVNVATDEDNQEIEIENNDNRSDSGEDNIPTSKDITWQNMPNTILTTWDKDVRRINDKYIGFGT